MPEKKPFGLPIFVPQSKDGQFIFATVNGEQFLSVFTTKEFLSKFEKEAKQLGLGRTVELETPEVFCEFFERESPVTRLIVDPGKNSESWTPSLEMALDHIRRAPFGYFNAFIGEPGQCSQCTQKYLMAEVQICPGCRKGLCKNCLPKDRHNCGTVFQTTFVPDDPHGFEAGKLSVPNVSEKVLILFLHGSGPDAEVDVYVPLGEFSSTPRVIRNLAGANIGGKEILVCAIGDRIPACPPMSIARGNDSKIIRRFERLGAIIKAFTNAGYPSEQIFIAGHSAGAWVGLWGLATNPDAFAGIIGFAPAFAGHFGKRQAGFEELRKLAIDQIQKAKSLPSLIYLFQGDEFEAPHELEPVFANVPSVVLKTKTGEPGQMLTTTPLNHHCGAYHKDFELEERNNILEFISKRLKENSRI